MELKIIPLLWIKSSPVDRFWCLRWLSNYIDLPDMIRLFASGATNSLVAKIWTKDLATSCSVYRFSTYGRIWCSRCLNNRINVPNMIRSFASSATASLVAKNGTKELSHMFEDGFWCSRCLNDQIQVPNMIGTFASSATASLVAKNGTEKLSQSFED